MSVVCRADLWLIPVPVRIRKGTLAAATRHLWLVWPKGGVAPLPLTRWTDNYGGATAVQSIRMRTMPELVVSWTIETTLIGSSHRDRARTS